MSKHRGVVSISLMAVLAGCSDPPEPPKETGPVLSDTPLWTIEAPASLRQSCFGTSIALGDVNGDGQQDLVVAAPPCTMMKGKGSLAIYAGTGNAFAAEPVVAEVDWLNPNPNLNGRNSVVSIGNVNGDRFADILVRSVAAGTSIFAGGEDLAAVLRTPFFRVPYVGTQYGGFLSDLDGDGIDELVHTQGSTRVTTVYRATPSADAPFTASRVLTGSLARVIPVGDMNGDGAKDLLLGTAEGSALHLGCKKEDPGVCEGGLSVTPSWTASQAITGFIPDQNGDGHPEAVVTSLGRVDVHLFQPAGGISSAPIWSVLGDPAFPGLGGPLLYPGDLDKDGGETEFLLAAAGRLYAFFPAPAISAELRPGWAWPVSDALGQGFDGYVRYAAVRAGDLNGDGYADLIAGLAPPPDQLAPATTPRPGKIVALGGGKIPQPAPRPILKAAASCGLAGAEGKPDLTVDGDVIARTVSVDQRNFAPTACEVTERCVGAPGDRKLLRFSAAIANLGTGRVRIPPFEERPDLYEYDACHRHEHLIGFASYELIDSKNAVVSVGRKQGFYLTDITPLCGDAGPAYVAEDNAQTISPGWADVYTADYACQWLDITDVADGEYTLRVGVNANNLVEEQNGHPNSVDVRIKIAGGAAEVVR
ncbi:lysyl oxidase family protein [Myxococcaceae bacterium GXIMD 01537]